MTASGAPGPSGARALPKAPTGIRGFDDVTAGGLPRGRPTLVTGASGTGKTLFGVEFLVHGARELGEHGVLLSFEESAPDLAANVASLGFDLEALEEQQQLVVDAFTIDPETVTAGAFDLDGLFVRLQLAVDAVGAQRVVLDTVEVLLGALGDEGTVRRELLRLFRWLRDRGLTTVVTGERGREGRLTRFGIEEYVSDCVVVLDQRVQADVATRRLRIVKYRGSAHGTNEFPFLMTEHGLTVLPLTEVGLAYPAPQTRVSTGVADLDAMLGGGVYAGSLLLVSGGPGTGKTTVAAGMVEAACRRGERALLFSFEESPDQLVRNQCSVGLDLGRWVDEGSLVICSERATGFGLEAHLARLTALLDEHRPAVVALDALAALRGAGDADEVMSVIIREADLLKSRGVTSVLTTLTHAQSDDSTGLAVSPLMDSWLLLRNDERDGARTRLVSVVKSRGTAHSNEVHEFVLTDHGLRVVQGDGAP